MNNHIDCQQRNVRHAFAGADAEYYAGQSNILLLLLCQQHSKLQFNA